MREVVELNQRFDLKSDAVLLGANGEFLGQALGQKRAERLLASPYDAYVFAGFALDKLPPKMQYQVMERVSEGAGLLCVGPGSPDFFVSKRKIDPLPSELGGGLPALDGKDSRASMQAYRLRRGRAAWLNYGAWALTPQKPFSYQGLNEYDYRMLVVGRALLWAAGREGQVSITWVLADRPLTIERGAPANASVTLVSRAERPMPVKLALELRRAADGWKQPLGAPSVTLPPGQPVNVPVVLPRLRAGQYFVDAVATGARGAVEAFGAGTLEVTTPYGVEAVSIQEPFYERGERAQGTATLRGAAPAGSTLRLRFRDSYDRVLAQKDFPVAAIQSHYPFDYPTDAFSTILMRVEAVLVANGEEVEMKDASFTVPKRRRGQFNFLQWDTPNDVLGYYAWRKMQEAGMNLCLLGSFGESKTVPVLQACDVSLVPYSTRILDPKDDNGYMKPVCWNNEPAVTEVGPALARARFDPDRFSAVPVLATEHALVLLVAFEPGQEIPLHAPDVDLVITVASGSGELYADGRVHPLEPGDSANREQRENLRALNVTGFARP